MITAYPYGYLHSNGNNCTGKSLGLFAYRTSKGVKLIKSTDALIHFGYTRYFHYYRIRKLLRNHLFYLCLYLFEMLRTLQEGERYKLERRSKPKETPAGIPVGVSCILKGFDVVFRVFLPQFGIEASFLRVENHMV